MIHLTGIEKRFGTQEIFRDLSWHIKPGQRVGLIGPNGAGKTTLMKIVVGDELPDAGDIVIAKNRTFGYLRQDIATLAGRTVRDEVRSGLSDLLRVEAQLADLEEAMATETDRELEQLMQTYGTLQAEFERDGGFRMDSRVDEVLSGLGFKVADFDRDCGELSGGWQMRVVLARLLLQEPDILLLDEPTNHLDLESLVWLEGFLQAYRGSLVFISHDRWFLNKLASHIAELSSHGLRVYTGNFEAYLRQAEEERALLERRHKNLQRRAADMERFIERFRAKATKAKQVQSRVKALEKMERVELTSDSRTIQFTLPAPPKSGRVVLSMFDVSKAYGDKHVYAGLDLQLLREQKIALVGPNGAGKSTLLKMLAGVVPSSSGTRELGFGARLYYFAQHQLETLNPKNNVLQEVRDDTQDLSITQLRSMLGAFLFGGDDVEKQIDVLSGGEKARVTLVKMLLTPVNLLLLDEPTNHLDMASRAVLEEALSAFDGTMVVISHDRHFLDAVCTEVWEIEEGRITPFLGSYSDYLDRIEKGDRPEPLPLHSERSPSSKMAPSRQPTTSVESGTARLPVQPTDSKPEPGMSINWTGGSGVPKRKTKEEKRRDAELRQSKSIDSRRLRKAYASAEQLVTELESELESLRLTQAQPDHYSDAEIVRRVAQHASTVERRLEKAYADWETAGAALEEHESSPS
ncbi:MAG: ABC-F family ATP-binding cassette domain-containing protein [Myxococcota bacterium]|nr:ABC-F family ATP-binding cassette domain-containing protein [Myxococcota bacterium]